MPTQEHAQTNENIVEDLSMEEFAYSYFIVFEFCKCATIIISFRWNFSKDIFKLNCLLKSTEKLLSHCQKLLVGSLLFKGNLHNPP